ncbi:MAG: hypothetical protein D6753_13925, partial [Planctomycetota bacterium]
MTRRLFCSIALGSTAGAGGMGASSPLAAGAAAGAEVQPHASQPSESQQLERLRNSLLSNPQRGLQQATASQPLSQQAAVSQPQLGPAPHPQGSQALTSQPQAGPAPAQGSQAFDSQPQDGS